MAARPSHSPPGGACSQSVTDRNRPEASWPQAAASTRAAATASGMAGAPATATRAPAPGWSGAARREPATTPVPAGPRRPARPDRRCRPSWGASPARRASGRCGPGPSRRRTTAIPFGPGPRRPAGAGSRPAAGADRPGHEPVACRPRHHLSLLRGPAVDASGVRPAWRPATPAGRAARPPRRAANASPTGRAARTRPADGNRAAAPPAARAARAPAPQSGPGPARVPLRRHKRSQKHVPATHFHPPTAGPTPPAPADHTPTLSGAGLGPAAIDADLDQASPCGQPHRQCRLAPVLNAEAKPVYQPSARVGPGQERGQGDKGAAPRRLAPGGAGPARGRPHRQRSARLMRVGPPRPRALGRCRPVRGVDDQALDPDRVVGQVEVVGVDPHLAAQSALAARLGQRHLHPAVLPVRLVGHADRHRLAGPHRPRERHPPARLDREGPGQSGQGRARPQCQQWARYPRHRGGPLGSVHARRRLRSGLDGEPRGAVRAGAGDAHVEVGEQTGVDAQRQPRRHRQPLRRQVDVGRAKGADRDGPFAELKDRGGRLAAPGNEQFRRHGPPGAVGRGLRATRKRPARSGQRTPDAARRPSRCPLRRTGWWRPGARPPEAAPTTRRARLRP